MEPGDEELPVYSGDEDQPEENKTGRTRIKKGTFSGLHAAGFSEFLLKEELMNAIQKCGFEHPSEVQQETLP